MNEKMDCKDLVEVVTDYIEGTLEPDLVRTLDAHLPDCPACVEYIAQMRKTMELAGRITVDDVSPEAEQALLDVFRNVRRR